MPAITIENHYVETFSQNVRMLAEQTNSFLLPYVTSETDVGEALAIDRMGSIGPPEEVTSLYQDTNLSEGSFDRRWLFPRDYNLGSLIDKVSKVRMLSDPNSRITMRHAGAFGRHLDDSIIAAMVGNAQSGKTQGSLTSVALPAGQQISSSTLNLAALQEIVYMFQANDYMSQDGMGNVPQIIGVCSPWALTRQLLGTTQASSADYNTVKTLVSGQIDTFMGIKFVVTNRLPLSGSTRTCLFFSPQHAVHMGWNMPIVSTVSNRPDKRNIPQILTEGMWGCTRVEDEAVVALDITES